MAAKLVNKREPLMCIKPFKFLRRQYNIGGIIDRRVVRMPHRKMTNLINSGNIELCCDMAKEDLEEFGYSYDIKNGRYPLLKIVESKKSTLSSEIEDPTDIAPIEPLDYLDPNLVEQQNINK